MGLFSKIFGKKKAKSKAKKPYNTTNGYGYWFKNVKSKRESDTIQAAINVIALHGSKMKLKHKEDEKSALAKLLNGFPNPYMSMQQFMYKWISLCLYYDNAFVYPKYDYMKGEYESFWILNPACWTLVTGADNSLWVQFTFAMGEEATLPYENLLHLRNYFVDDDIRGGLSNDEMYLNSISSYDTARNSIAQATITSTRVIGKLLLNDSLSETDKDKAIARFNEFLEKTENKSAVYPEDMNSTLDTIDLKPKSAASQQLASLKSDLLQHIPISEVMLSGKYSEQDFNAFYETILEPLSLQITQVSTHGLLTEQQRTAGEEVIATTNLLQHASWKTKIAVVNLLKDIRGIKIGDIREMFGYEYGDDGDEYMQSLNFVAGSKADEYQTGKGEDEDEQE